MKKSILPRTKSQKKGKNVVKQEVSVEPGLSLCEDTSTGTNQEGVAAVVTVGGVETVGGHPLNGVSKQRRRFNWRLQESDHKNFKRLAKKLRKLNPGLYRNGTGRQGLVYIDKLGKVTYVCTGSGLLPIVIDTIDMFLQDAKKDIKPGNLSATKLNAMLAADCFLDSFPPLDRVVYRPTYRDDFTIIQPGYDPVERVYFIGKMPEISDSMKTLETFLDSMAFASNADRTNAVAGALTCLLGNHWPGAKPLLYVTANKSHAGKGTVVNFMRGRLAKVDILYQTVDWPMRNEMQTQLMKDPQIGFIDVDNVRLASRGTMASIIASGFLESLLMSPRISMAAPGMNALDRPNDLVMSLNTNDGQLSPDLLNRALPIRLEVCGDIDDRTSQIGNPKLEFLPQNEAAIEAELHGMIARWVAAGCQLDESVWHSMLPWARVIGGILKVNGFTDFLANYRIAKSVDDPIRVAIGTLASNHVGEPMSASAWVAAAKREGVSKTLFNSVERENDESMARSIGSLLSKQLGSKFLIDRDGHQIPVRLLREQRRWNRGENGSRKYVFRPVADEQQLTNEPVPDVEEYDEPQSIDEAPFVPLPAIHGMKKRKAK